MSTTAKMLGALGMLAAIVALGAATASAQTAPEPGWPTKPIRMLVPISAGSVTDVAARLTAQDLTASLGQQVLVVNKPGAKSVIAAKECAKAAPDGYTICLASPDTLSYNPFTVDHLGYDPDKDFRPITDMYHVIEGFMARKDLPANSMAELHTLAIARAGRMTYGTFGERTTTDAFRRWLSEQWKTNFISVPYKGGGEIMAALLAGQVDVTRIGVGNMAAQLRDGKIKMLAQRGTKRSAAFPNVQTFDEADLRGFPGGPVYWGVIVPTGVPDAIAGKLHAALVKSLNSAKFAEFAQKQFLEPVANTPAEFAAFIKTDRANAGKVVKAYMQN